MTDQSFDNEKKVEASHFLQYALKHLDVSKGSSVIDFGCGSLGYVGRLLLPDAKKVIFCDNSEKAISELKENLKSVQLDNYEIWGNGINEDEENIADVILSSMVMHHIEDIKKEVNKCFKLMKKGGKILFMDLKTEDGSFHGTMIVPHNGFNPTSVKEIFEEVGFVNVVFEDYEPFYMKSSEHS